MTDIPTPGRLINSRCASSKTGSGSTAGPALKLKIRSVIRSSLYGGRVSPPGYDALNLLTATPQLRVYTQVHPYEPFSYSLRNMRPAARTTNERGTKRSASTIKRFAHPETMLLLRAANPLSAVSTTSSGVCDDRAGGLCPRAASKKFVSVTPGQSAITVTPKERFSSHNASENDSTNALVAA